VFFNKALHEFNNTKGMYKNIAQEDCEFNIQQHVVHYCGPRQKGGGEGEGPIELFMCRVYN
jgi:hypothetical protein